MYSFNCGLASAEQRENHTFNFQPGRGLPISRVAAVFSRVLTVQIVNDQRVHVPLPLDAALLAGVDHRRAFLPLHRDVRLGHLTTQVSRAALLQLQILEDLYKGDWRNCGEDGTDTAANGESSTAPDQN